MQSDQNILVAAGQYLRQRYVLRVDDVATGNECRNTAINVPG